MRESLFGNNFKLTARVGLGRQRYLPGVGQRLVVNQQLLYLSFQRLSCVRMNEWVLRYKGWCCQLELSIKKGEEIARKPSPGYASCARTFH